MVLIYQKGKVCKIAEFILGDLFKEWQRHIFNTVKHLRLRFLRLLSLNYFHEKLHLDKAGRLILIAGSSLTGAKSRYYIVLGKEK